MKRRWVWFLSGFVVVLVVLFWLVLRAAAPTQLELSVLRGLKPVEVRPAGNKRSTTVAIYYVQGHYDAVVRSIEAEIGTPGPASYPHRAKGWYIDAGPFELNGPSVSIRPNKVDPESMAVLGTAADSDRWVTVAVRGSRRDPNWLNGIKRLIAP